jgi:hypothetical protein
MKARVKVGWIEELPEEPAEEELGEAAEGETSEEGTA